MNWLFLQYLADFVDFFNLISSSGLMYIGYCLYVSGSMQKIRTWQYIFTTIPKYPNNFDKIVHIRGYKQDKGADRTFQNSIA